MVLFVIDWETSASLHIKLIINVKITNKPVQVKKIVGFMTLLLLSSSMHDLIFPFTANIGNKQMIVKKV